jgi:hypothetical protein
MFSTLYHERLVSDDGMKNPMTGLKVRFGGYGVDEIAIFALVAAAVLYIAVASCWFVY